jgi:hypothetical protein
VSGALRLFPGAGRHAGVHTAVNAPARPTMPWLRRQCTTQLRALAAELRDAEGDLWFRRAADAYDAAALLADHPDGMLDMVAAIVLARDGLMAIAYRTSAPVPPCFPNPLHGRSSRSTQWPPGIRCPHAVVPACRRCAYSPYRQMLYAPDSNGELVPYFQIPGFWGRTGFGAFEHDFPRHVLERLKVD